MSVDARYMFYISELFEKSRKIPSNLSFIVRPKVSIFGTMIAYGA